MEESLSRPVHCILHFLPHLSSQIAVLISPMVLLITNNYQIRKNIFCRRESVPVTLETVILAKVVRIRLMIVTVALHWSS
jgi:hypothetical protein